MWGNSGTEGRSETLILVHVDARVIKSYSFVRMEGAGEFVFPTGTKYVGEMKDGM